METERLILRPFNDSDIKSVFEIFSDEEVNRFLPWFPLENMEQVDEFYRSRLSGTAEPVFAICFKNDNIPIGYIHGGTPDNYDFGYALKKEFWHMGIVTEAGRALLAYLKAQGVPYITATHDINNPRSGGVMQNLGMKYRYSYREQWQPKNIPVIFRMYQLDLNGSPPVYRGYADKWQNSFIEKI